MNDETKNDSLLRVKDLSVSFATDEGEVQALDAVDFEVKQGQTLAPWIVNRCTQDSE